MTDGLLPRWIAIAWIAILLGVVLAHCRPLILVRGRLRLWHCLHCAMAVTMALMYASASLVAVPVSGMTGTMSLAASGLLALGAIGVGLSGRSTGGLWPLALLDLLAMSYMLRSGHPVAAISWLLVAYLVVQMALWTTAAGARLTLRAHGPRDVAIPRFAMMLMPASMVYMLIAMQLPT